MFFYIHAYIHTDIHIYVVNKCIYIYVYLIFLINVNGKVQVAHALLSPPGRQVTAPLHLVAAPAFCSLNNTWHSKLLVRSKGRLVQWLFRMYFLSSTTQGRHRPATTPSGLGRADLRRRVTRHRRTIARLSLGRPSPNAALLRALSRIAASRGGRAWCVADIFKGFFCFFFFFPSLLFTTNNYSLPLFFLFIFVVFVFFAIFPSHTTCKIRQVLLVQYLPQPPRSTLWNAPDGGMQVVFVFIRARNETV